MSTPAWYREAVALHGERTASGSETREEASAAMAVLLAAHPEFLAEIGGRDVAKWTRKHAPVDLFASALFPMIPAYLPVSPTTSARTEDMTYAELEKAKRMVLTRTGNMARTARVQRKAFTEFYNLVRELVKSGMTVGEATARLAAQEPKDARKAAA
jgi:hypothetical protein